MSRSTLFLTIALTLSASLFALSPPSYQPIERLPRSFEEGISEAQIDDLHYLLSSLAFNSYEDILANRIQLQAAMQRIDLVHPLHYLIAIFSDSWLIKSVHAICAKEWLWRHFCIKIKRSLEEEKELDNMLPEYVLHFCNCINLNFERTMSMVEEGDWDGLISSLLIQYPTIED